MKSISQFFRSLVFSLCALGSVLGALTVPISFAEVVAGAPVSQAVNINTATAEELAEALKGVGIKKAQAIIAYRKANGDFSSAEQLTEVKGIGEATVDKNRALITL